METKENQMLLLRRLRSKVESLLGYRSTITVDEVWRLVRDDEEGSKLAVKEMGYIVADLMRLYPNSIVEAAEDI